MALHRQSKLRVPSAAALHALSDVLASLRIGSSFVPRTAARYASHQSQGRANGAKDGPGKRLGAKKTGGEYVVPGNILYKQRGTLWFPGENTTMGRDHTIHAALPGWVRYYRDPLRHPKRKYIGVAIEKNLPLPTPHNAIRRRRLGMLAYKTPPTTEVQEGGDLNSGPEIGLKGNVDSEEAQPSTVRQLSNEDRVSNVTIRKNVPGARDQAVVDYKLTLRPGYQYRLPNWYIGRAAERKQEALKRERAGKRTAVSAGSKRGKNQFKRTGKSTGKTGGKSASGKKGKKQSK